MTYYHHPLITDEERRAYGDEALSVMERKAREVIAPVVDQVSRQNQQLRHELQAIKQSDVWSALDAAMPNWREINQSPEWHAWLREGHAYTGASKQQLLNNAFAAGAVGPILAMFQDFVREHGGARPARHVWSQRGEQPREQRPVTVEDINHFYDRVRRGHYSGREADKDRDERRLHAAIHRGK